VNQQRVIVASDFFNAIRPFYAATRSALAKKIGLGQARKKDDES
jgi:predicted transcriptional regulator